MKKSTKKVAKPTPAQAKALRSRKTSFAVIFERRKAITQAKGKDGALVKARAPGKLTVTSLRRFGSESEAKRHGKRFTKIEDHKGFSVKLVKLRPNAWVNARTGKTNPMIGAKRTGR
jgi:hypothetical protein